MIGTENELLKFEDYITGEKLYCGRIDNYIDIDIYYSSKSDMIPQVPSDDVYKYKNYCTPYMLEKYTEFLGILKSAQMNYRKAQQQRSDKFDQYDSEIASILKRSKLN